MLGFDLIVMLFSYKIAADSAASLIQYWATYFFVSGIIVFPLLCWLYRAQPVNVTRAAYALLTACGFALYLTADGNIPLLAGASVLVSMPFWSAYHLTFTACASDSNRGNEVSVAYVIIALGAVTGYLTGGALADKAAFLCGILAFASMAGGTLILGFLLQKPDGAGRFPVRLIDTFRRGDHTIFATLLAGGEGTMHGFMLPTFLKSSGMGALGAGFTLALRACTGVIVSPLAGHLAGKNRNHNLMLGVALFTAAWLALLLPLPLPVRLVIGFICWSAGGQIYFSGMDASWYSIRTPEAIAAREILLNLGRLAALFAAAPLLFAAPAFYPLFAFCIIAAGGTVLFFLMRRRPVTSP